MKAEQIARVVHEANRAYCHELGDTSHKPFDDITSDLVQSSIQGVKFRLDHPEATAEKQHEQWMADKIKAGWVFGIRKDAALKTHPSLVQYSQLPESERRKDWLFSAIVNALK